MEPAAQPLELADPAGRPEVGRIAAEAAAVLSARLAVLSPEQRAWLAATPLERAADAFNAYPRATEYGRLGRPGKEVLARVLATGDPSWPPVFWRLLVLSLLVRAPAQTPGVRIPVSSWRVFERGLRLLLAAMSAQEAEPWDDSLFRKDVAIALLRLLPGPGAGLGIINANPWSYMRVSTWRERASVVAYLGLDAFRTAPYLTAHAWREFAPAVRDLGMDTGFATDLVLANPSIRGTLGGGWTTDPALRTITPHLWEHAERFRGRGGRTFRMPTRENDALNALQKSAHRRQLHAEGKYQPRVYYKVLKRRDFIRATQEEERAAAIRESADGRSQRT